MSDKTIEDNEFEKVDYHEDDNLKSTDQSVHLPQSLSMISNLLMRIMIKLKNI